MVMIVVILIILCLNTHLAVLADEEITESYVIKALEGEDQNTNLSGDKNHLNHNIPLLSLSINFSPETLKISKDSYQKLAILSNVISDFKQHDGKFIITCCHDIRDGNRDKISIKLIKSIKKYILSKLPDMQQGVVIRTAKEHPSILQTSIEAKAGTGRLELFRVE